MTAVDLRFAQPSATDAELRFGAAEAPATSELTLVAVLPALQFAAQLVPSIAVRLTAVLPPLQFIAEASYDPRVERPTVAHTEAAWQPTFVRETGARQRHHGANAIPAGVAAAWQPAAGCGTGLGIPTPYHRLRTRVGPGITQTTAQPIATQVAHYRHGEALRLARGHWRLPQQDGRPRRGSIGDDWQQRARDRRPQLQARLQDAIRWHRPWRAHGQAGLRVRFALLVPGQEAWPPRPGRWSPPVSPPPGEPCYSPSPQLCFTAPPGGSALLFVCEHGVVAPPVVIPVRKVYFVSNAVTLVRLPERTALPVRSVEVSVDAESWCWGFTASLAASALDAVAPTMEGPVEVELTINDVVWALLVESYSLHREFGRATLSIRGRSPTAWLAAPYAPLRSWTQDGFATARQLADAELTRDGATTGFTLDWQLPDWLVPTGAWSYQALTPIEALGRIVGAVGGSLLPGASAQELKVLARYPALPWEWSTTDPAVELPLDAVATLDLRWQEQPAYNAVFVAGERQGIVGHVVRAGTAGDRVAPVVVDPLITAAEAARERGRAILGDTGRQARVTLELPLLPEAGLLAPGLLVAIGDGAAGWRGLVRGTRVAAAWNESLTVRQTVEVERHYA